MSQNYTHIGFIVGQGIYYRGSLSKIPKSKNILQPIFEAITNAFEAIKLNGDSERKVVIEIKKSKTILSDESNIFEFEAITISDTGIGFNDKEFKRFCDLHDNSKSFYNMGSGRVQYVHFFDKVEYKSIYVTSESDTGFKERLFVISGNNVFLQQNAIVKQTSIKDIDAVNSGSIMTFTGLISKSDKNYYNTLSSAELKQDLINHYLAYFCENRESLPIIEFRDIINGEISGDPILIIDADIPKAEKDSPITINYRKISEDGQRVDMTERTEQFSLKGFKIPKEDLSRNTLRITSKGEIAKELKIDVLSEEDVVNGSRYLFLLSGEYFNINDSDNRGDFTNLQTLKEFKANPPLNGEQIIIDDICDATNRVIGSDYPEIVESNKQHDEDLAKLRSMFLLNPESIKAAKIKPGDSEKTILEKVYKADASLYAKKDAEIKLRIDKLENFNPNDKENFTEEFSKEVEELTKLIPLQNRMALCQYVARRNLTLQLFSKILDNQLSCQAGRKTIDEALIHNLLFQKGDINTEDSNLWIINEDFIYFSGFSEKQLNKVEINGEIIFKDQFNEEEERYLLSLGENRKIKRPDILLFPDEGKCIIIELKSPDVSVRTHLSQIDFYAGMIRNYTQDKFSITNFYGYIIGESIEPNDVILASPRFENAYNFDYMFRPAEPVAGLDGRSKGSIYTEVIKYTTLLKRAELRNKIFYDKLFANVEDL